MPARKTLGLLAAAATLVLLSSAITYAATTSGGSTVLACRAANGRLALLSAKGRCARGFHKVTLNQRGPIGPRGATGRTGARGPAGPGAVPLVAVRTDASGTAEAGPVDFAATGIRMSASCHANGSTDVYVTDATGAGGDVEVEGVLDVVGNPGAAGTVYQDAAPTRTISMPGSFPVAGSTTGGKGHFVRIELTNGGSAVQLIAQRGPHTVTLSGSIWQSSFNCEALLQAVPSS